MYITEARMLALVPNARHDLAGPLASALDENLDAFAVTSPLRRAHLMGQLAVESAGFSRLEENLNYTTAERIAAVWPRLVRRAASLVRNPQALANSVYALKNGNGDEKSGDGWRYRGRGLIQLTGAANYRAAQGALGIDLMATPDEACAPANAARIALWFWRSHGCNDMADRDDVSAVTRAINGPAMEQANIRRALTEKAKGIFTREVTT